MELQIGSQLRRLRKSAGLSIADLSVKSGVSTGLISQIERDMVVPSVVSLYRIAQALDTNLNYFFEDATAQSCSIIRRGDHKSIITCQGSSRYDLLVPEHMEHVLDLVKVTLKGGETYDHDCVTHAGEECGYVLSGILTVLLEGRQYQLYPGDSMFFYSTQPHKYINNEKEDCVSIWGMTPKFF
ncbi:MAG: cupin domain-containing protein [Oscillibacter sp.]|jgi:transcriptional regulator with XRE-family HTH domain|nr:cupin domain-containing protein [Oscillibacter sp.]